MYIETQFCIYQARKILSLKKEPMNKYTSVFSYFIIKAELLMLFAKKIYFIKGPEQLITDSVNTTHKLQKIKLLNHTKINETLKMNAIDLELF